MIIITLARGIWVFVRDKGNVFIYFFFFWIMVLPNRDETSCLAASRFQRRRNSKNERKRQRNCQCAATERRRRWNSATLSRPFKQVLQPTSSLEWFKSCPTSPAQTGRPWNCQCSGEAVDGILSFFFYYLPLNYSLSDDAFFSAINYYFFPIKI